MSTSSIEADETEMHQMLGILIAGAMQVMRSASGVLTGDQLVCERRRVRLNLPVILCVTYKNAVSAEKARSLAVAELIPLVVWDIARVIRRVLDHSPR